MFLNPVVPSAPHGLAASAPFGHTLRMLETVEIDGRAVELLLPEGDLRDRLVLLAHDGQNCFSGERSLAGTGWYLQDAIPRVSKALGIPEPIVIAPWNAGVNRGPEYAPEDVLAADPVAAQGFADWFGGRTQLLGNAYVHWCAERVLPWLSAHHAVALRRESVAVMGSSMGGLASMYALAKRPDVYGAALCLSTHWTPGGVRFPEECVDLLPQPGEHYLWLDHGDAGLDATYQPFQEVADARLVERGWAPYVESHVYPGADHHERDWAHRVDQVLTFWLTRRVAPTG